MLGGLIFSLLAAATITALLWCGTQLVKNQDDPLADRLEELQSHAMVAAPRTPRRKGGGGFFGRFLYLVSLAGGEGWLRDAEKELNQAGMRGKGAVAWYALINVVFVL